MCSWTPFLCDFPYGSRLCSPWPQTSFTVPNNSLELWRSHVPLKLLFSWLHCLSSSNTLFVLFCRPLYPFSHRISSPFLLNPHFQQNLTSVLHLSSIHFPSFKSQSSPSSNQVLDALFHPPTHSRFVYLLSDKAIISQVACTLSPCLWDVFASNHSTSFKVTESQVNRVQDCTSYLDKFELYFESDWS